MARGLKLEELEVYKVAMEIGELVWQIVMKWEYFDKKTLGGQFVNAADSIAFNIVRVTEDSIIKKIRISVIIVGGRQKKH